MNTHLSRRDFTRLASFSVLAAAAGRANGAATPVPKLGMCLELEKAALIRDSGGDFLEAGVGSLLVPDEDDGAFRKKLEALKACPLPVPVCNGFIRRKDLVCVGPSANHDEVIRHVTVSITRAKVAGVKTIVFGSSGTRRIPDGWDAKRAMEQFVAVLKRMAPVAADNGVVIAVEPLNAKECNFIQRIGEVAEAVAGADHPAVKGVADLYHMIRGGDTPDDLRKAISAVHHVEIADPTRDRALPAPGGQDFQGFFQVLKDAGFAGTLSMEGHWQPPDVPVAFAEIRKQWGA